MYLQVTALLEASWLSVVSRYIVWTLMRGQVKGPLTVHTPWMAAYMFYSIEVDPTRVRNASRV